MHPFFTNYPEEVVNQPFTISRVDTLSNEKEDYTLSSNIINEIFWNYSVITQEESQLSVLKNIIIPHFSQTIFALNSDITNSKLIFHFYESLSNLFLEKYKTYLSEVKFLKKSKIDFTNHATKKDDIETIEKLKNNVQKKIQNHIMSNTLYISFLSNTFKSDNIIQIIDNNPIDLNILGYSFIWSIYHSDFNVLLKCFEKTFLFKKVDIQKFKTDQFFNIFNEKTVIYEQDFPQSIIKINQNLLESSIIYDKSPLNSEIPQSCSFAATPNILLVFNTFTDKQQPKHFLKINICNHNMTKNDRYTIISNKIDANYFVQSIGNDALVYDTNGKLFLSHHECQYLDKFVQIKQSFFQHIPFPFTTDGYYIYSIHNNKEIGVYELDKNKHVLTFVKKIIINDHSNNITEPYNDTVISNELLKKANIITNGIVIEFIVHERIENNKFVHFARCVSLVTGNHVGDFHFSLPFPIHSMSFDPISKRIWTLTIRKEESIFHQFKYRGPEPFWLSKFEVTSLYNSTRFSNYYGFVEVFINYVHSVVCQFFGSDFSGDDEIPAFLTSISGTEMINLILCLLDLPPNNYKYVEILFVLLSFQFKYNKVTKEQIKYLSNTIKKYLKKPDLYNFLIMFVIDITFYLKSNDISMFFELVLESSDRNIQDMDLLLNLLLRYDKSKKFPYILDNNYHLILHELLNQLNDKTISIVGINFLMTYQSAIFLNYARIYQTKTLKIHKIENIIVYYISSFFCNALLFIQNVKSLQYFDQSLFSLMLKKLLMDLRLTAHLSSFILALLPILLNFLKEISKLQLFEENVENSFYVFYLYVFSLYVFCFKRMFSFSNIDVIKNHYPLLDVQMQKEKTVSDIFENKLNDDDFTNVINTIYNKVSNPLNKHLSSEDKEVEKNLFLSLIYKTNSIKEICTLNDEIKAQNNIKIPQSIKQITQIIYKIRSNLRFKKQNGTKNDYLKLLNNYIEKSHFLLQFHSEKFTLNEISKFLNDKVKVSQIIQEQTKLESVKKNLDLFIPMFNSFITKDLPTNLIYFFIMNIASSEDIISANEIVNKYVTINLQTSKDLIYNLIEQMTIMPPNAIISMVIYLFFVLLTSYKPEEIHEVYYFSITKMLSKLIEISKTTEEIVFKSCISIICHLNSIFIKEKLFVMTNEEKENIIKILNDLELKYSMSLELAHSELTGLLSNNNFPYNLLTQLLGFVGQNEFHQMSLLIYDYLKMFSDNNQEKDFMKLFEQILDIIGTVLSGSYSNKLLQIAFPIHQIQEAKDEKFIRTPTSQLACVLDLIQIIRRFILQSESNAHKMILNHFKWIFEHFQPDNQQYMKHLYAILSVMSNLIQFLRPYSLVKTNDNKTYFITALDEENNKIKGLFLPVTKQQFYKHELDFSPDLKSFEIIQYNLALLKNFEFPFSLFKKALNLENKESSYSLFKIYTLQWIKNNILDSENGKEFTEKFFNKIKNRVFKNFVFSDHLDIVLTILKKSLVLQTEGVFTNSVIKPKLYHISFTNIVFEHDYSLTETEIKTIKSPHVFISSILNDPKPIFFGINYTKLTYNFIFGIIVHSIEHNKMISIKYSSKDSKFSINGEKKYEYKLKANTLIECLYFPSKNLVSFADSNNKNAIFSVDLGQRLKCSFFILVYPDTKLQYYCDLTPQTDCFKNHQNSKFSNVNHGITATSLLCQKDYTEELEGIIHYTCEFKEIRYQRKNSLNLEESNIKIQTLFTLTELTNLPETDLFMTNYKNSYFYSLLSNICSTPLQLDQYVQFHDVSGTFNLIDQQNAIIEHSNSIPALDIQKYQNLPSEILNYYMNEACELYQKEIMTLFAVQVFANSKDIYSSLNHFSMSTLAIVNFITSVLFLLEPIKFSNLHNKKSPIDFVGFNGLKTCAKTDLYDYYTALTQIIDFITENDLEKFIYKWFKQLQKDFRNKYMHFVSQNNSNIINIRSSITKEFQCFNLDNVSGWIVFPYKFGCYKIQQISIDNAIFPKLSTDKANYFYCEKKELKIKPITCINNDNLTTFGIIPLYNKSNESLFYSFYHLAISFKYFVIFSHKNIPSKMKQKIWKLVINSIVAGSPFFYSHSYEVLLFLQKNLQLETNQENISMLNSLHISNSLLGNPEIKRFLFSQSFYLNNELSKKLEYYIFEKDQMPPKDIKYDCLIIPIKLDNSVNTEVLVDVVSTILLYKENNNNNENHFPYHLIMSEWVDSFLHYPPSTVENIGGNVVKITFLAFIPTTFQLITTGYYNQGDLYISKTNDFSKCTEKFNIYNLRTSIDYLNQYKPINPGSTNNIFYVKFPNQTNIDNYHFKVYSYFYINNKNISEIIYSFRNIIKNDFKDFNTKFTKSDDQKILSCVDSNKFSTIPMETRLTTFEIGRMINSNHPLYLNNLRAIYLFTINYLFLNEKRMSEKLSENNSLERFFSNGIFSNHFRKLIDSHNSNDYINMVIDRQKGLDYRNGINNLVSNSMIAQFTEFYIKKPNSFRNKSTPFSIRYDNERGIDAGGLMRDFFTELINDLKTPRVGLFIQTPNGRNHEGNYQDCLVPSPAPEISKSDKYYQSIGALIAIAIRTEMKQPDLIFPSFFWNFIITGKLKIDDIYEIDKSYKDVTTNLLHSVNIMNDVEFENLISITTIFDLRGNPIRIDLGNHNRNSSSLRISKSNCARFIAICNDYRLNELINPLQKIRDGFWQNLAIEPPPFVTPSLLESMACGNRIITVEDLRAMTRFNGVAEIQKNFFWETVTRMNNDERKKLIHFSTGLNSLNSRGLCIDNLGSQYLDHLPTASTCFFSLHLPPYSNADRMYNAFVIAINETGTFENA